MSPASMYLVSNLILLLFSLGCAVFVATRHAKDRGFFSLPPVFRGIIGFIFGPTIVGAAIIFFPITLYIWYLRRRNPANYIDNSEMLAKLKKQAASKVSL